MSMPLGRAAQIRSSARTIVVVEWPSRDVPESLARAGHAVEPAGMASVAGTSILTALGEVGR